MLGRVRGHDPAWQGCTPRTPAQREYIIFPLLQPMTCEPQQAAGTKLPSRPSAGQIQALLLTACQPLHHGLVLGIQHPKGLPQAFRCTSHAGCSVRGDHALNPLQLRPPPSPSDNRALLIKRPCARSGDTPTTSRGKGVVEDARGLVFRALVVVARWGSVRGGGTSARHHPSPRQAAAGWVADGAHWARMSCSSRKLDRPAPPNSRFRSRLPTMRFGGSAT